MHLHFLPDQQERGLPDDSVPCLGVLRFPPLIQHLEQEQRQEAKLITNQGSMQRSFKLQDGLLESSYLIFRINFSNYIDKFSLTNTG